MKNWVKVSFAAQAVNERFARMTAAAFILPAEPTMATLGDVKTAVSEAVTNAIIHGYDGSDGMVELELELEDGLLRVTVRDGGVGIADIARAREPLFTTKPDGERSGIGFTVMESFMDSLHIESEVGRGTVVTMTKQLGV